MNDIWFTSDHHFDHANILRFTGDDGLLIRPGFDSVEHMNEHMIAAWNSVIKPGDKVYHLGDFCFKADTAERIISRLHGRKRLLPGNHDPIKEIAKYFEKVQLWRIFKEQRFICTHVPIRAEQFRHKVLVNVHGHLHQNIIKDEQYHNVCVECTGYVPVHMDELIKLVRKLY